MDDFQRAALHRVFPIERKRDALIVIPAGDATGFSGTQFHAELSTILKLLDRPEFSRLIVDLGHSNYFGSEMIGAINTMGTHIRERGGYFAVCGASPDMRAGLNMLNLDQHWMLFPTRKHALRAITSDSLAFRLAVIGGILVAVGIVAVAVFAAMAWAGRDRRAEHYQTLTLIWNDLQSFQAQDPNPPQWNVYSSQARGRLKPVLTDLAKPAEQKDPAREHLLKAAETLMVLLESPAVPTTRQAADPESPERKLQAVRQTSEAEFLSQMKAAQQLLKGQPAQPPPPAGALAVDGKGTMADSR